MTRSRFFTVRSQPESSTPAQTDPHAGDPEVAGAALLPEPTAPAVPRPSVRRPKRAGPGTGTTAAPRGLPPSRHSPRSPAPACCSPSAARADRGRGSPPGRTGTSGTPPARATSSAASHTGGRHHRVPHTDARQPTLVDRRGPRRQPVVHRVRGQPHRPHHPARRDHRVRACRGDEPSPTPSSRGRTARCGSSRPSARCSGGSRWPAPSARRRCSIRIRWP